MPDSRKFAVPALLLAVMLLCWGCGRFKCPKSAPAQASASLSAAGLSAALISRSVVSAGDPTRLERVLAKARRGEPIVVGTIGGSITEGAVASAPEKCWANQVAQWWRASFPKTHIEFVNAGIGATGSDIGTHRVKAHLLARRPDFVVAEFAVNDPNENRAAETMEGLVRQILAQPNQPALMLLFTMNSNGDNAQQWHTLVGCHYGLPMVSYRDACWPEIQAGRLKWEAISGDVVHPNDRGHSICASLLIAQLEKTLAALPRADKLPPVEPLPEPLFSDCYAHADLYNAQELAPTLNEGWRVEAGDSHFGPCWAADKPGSVLEFEVEGAVLSLMYYVVKGEQGMAKVQVDGGAPQTLDGWFDQTWGGYNACVILGKGLAPGRHKVRVTLLPDKAPASSGHKFQVRSIMAAGLPH